MQWTLDVRCNPHCFVRSTSQQPNLMGTCGRRQSQHTGVTTKGKRDKFVQSMQCRFSEQDRLPVICGRCDAVCQAGQVESTINSTLEVKAELPKVPPPLLAYSPKM